MFTYIKAKNFKSLKNIEFNLNRTKTHTNKLIAVYGENGSGKTNLVELLKFLQQLTVSRCVDVKLNMLPKEFYELKIMVQDKLPLDAKPMWELSLNLEEYRTINENLDTEIEYGFRINDKEGFYYIKFNTEIVEEKLYFFVNKQKGYYFNLSKDIKEFNKNIFKNEKYNEELKENIDKYWGKYSFLSLLAFEGNEKNEEYVKNNISIKVFEIVKKILTMTIRVNKWHLRFTSNDYMKAKAVLDLKSGTAEKSKIVEIKKYEKVLNIFFTQAYADIKSVEYNIEEQDDKIKYKLYFNKMIGGEIKSIPIEFESEGTKRIIEGFDALIGAIMGETVIIDEIDNGIHDLLMKNIILSIKDEITGQLIITTHNTLLLEILPKECIYILSTDYEGNKSINSIKEYGISIQKNHNVRDLYFKGIFGGIPTTSFVDFEGIKYVLEDSECEKRNSNNEKA